MSLTLTLYGPAADDETQTVANIAAPGVTSVAASGGTTGLSFTGSPITTGGTLTLTGTLAVAHGGTGTATTFTQGSVVFAGASGVHSQNNTNLFWDNTNARLGLGLAAPAVRLDVLSATGEISRFRSPTARGNGSAFITIYDPTGRKGYFGYGTATDVFQFVNELNAALIFSTNNAEVMRFSAGGNMGVGTTNPTARLSISGGALPSASSLGLSYSLAAGRLASGNTSNTTGVVNAFEDTSVVEISAGTTNTLVSGVVSSAGSAAVDPNTVKIFTNSTERMRIASGGAATFTGTIKGLTDTVANLPAAGTAGRRAFVTDANATTFASIVAGGGANGVPVYDDGTNWRIG